MRQKLPATIALVLLSGIVAACSARADNSSTSENGRVQAADGQAEDVERPDFSVVKSAPGPSSFAGDIELRRYEPVIVAETTVQAPNRSVASSRGFEPLAAFIFGKNRPSAEIAMTAPVTTSDGRSEEIAMTAPVTTAPAQSEEIAMTAPVTTSPAGADSTGEGGGTERTYTVRFTMPSKYTMETLPRPIDPAVNIVPLPARQIVALRFVGRPPPERIATAERAISSFVQENDLSPTGPFATAGYDGPSVPRSRQRWEVHLPVE